MPYIDKKRREELGRYGYPKNAGELNYRITQVMLEYLKDKGESYQAYNDIMGVLEGAKLELYRRKIGIYEDQKKEINGDVYTP